MIYSCDNCGDEIKTELHGHPMEEQQDKPSYQIGNGLALWGLWGGYGMFSDDMRVLLGDKEPPPTLLCHDCSAKVFRAIPNAVPSPSRTITKLPDGSLLYADLDEGGLHPYEEYPCCEWGWRGDRGDVR